MGIKLDMSKAYDKVKLDFLEVVMRKMGFDDRWVNLVMACVWSVSYAIVIHAQTVGDIKPSRGIFQGDLLSPYLFFICTEALSSLLQRAEQRESITGVPTSKHGPRVSHLFFFFFADDNLLFCKANSMEWKRLMRILERYETASGQQLNMHKTSIFFSRNMDAARRQEIISLSGLQATQGYDKYLGLPTLVGEVSNSSFLVHQG